MSAEVSVCIGICTLTCFCLLRSARPGQPGEGTRSFLLSDSGKEDDNRMLIFGNPSTIPRIAFAERLHCDGTFWVTPKLFNQLLTIHMMIYGQMFPVLYVLLNGKSEQLYLRMFHEVFQILARLGINQFHYLTTFDSDFENGLIAAVEKSFPGVTHQGCYFHFCQAIYRNVVKLGYKSDYQKDATFRESVRALLALGHVPSEHKLSYYLLRLCFRPFCR